MEDHQAEENHGVNTWQHDSHDNMTTWHGGFLEWWYQPAIGFPTKNAHFGVWHGGKPTIKGNTHIAVDIATCQFAPPKLGVDRNSIPSRLPSRSNEVKVQGPRPAVWKPWQDTLAENPIKNCPIWMMRWKNFLRLSSQWISNCKTFLQQTSIRR